MIETVKHLMNCGVRIVYGYTQSDEISLLLHPNETSFNRKERKLNSILPGEASAKE
jgi:tRNA(His) guanylyltransferase